MTADNVYSKSEISTIPFENLKEIINDEIVALLFDFGQKVGANDPEFNYLVAKTTEVLRSQYPKWKLFYLDECFRNGKQDVYDKGQKVTMKRLEYWFKSYNIHTSDALKDQWKEKSYSELDNTGFFNNSCRFPNIIKFRQARKPEYDGEDWTLEKIEQLPEYQHWLSLRSRKAPDLKNLINKK